MKRLAKYLLGRGDKRSEVDKSELTPKVIIFDFDGTLADTFDIGRAILNALADEFDYRKVKPDEVEKVRDMRAPQVLKYLGIRPTKLSKISRRAGEELSLRIEGVKPLRGIASVVRELHERGFRVGILTSNTQENVSIFLRNHDLEIFDFIRCSSKLMGKAREVKAIRKEFKLSRPEILLVGDETRDVEAAHKAGVAIAAIAGGYNSRSALEKSAPHFLLSEPEELLTLLSRPGDRIA